VPTKPPPYTAQEDPRLGVEMAALSHGVEVEKVTRFLAIIRGEVASRESTHPYLTVHGVSASENEGERLLYELAATNTDIRRFKRLMREQRIGVRMVKARRDGHFTLRLWWPLHIPTWCEWLLCCDWCFCGECIGHW